MKRFLLLGAFMMLSICVQAERYVTQFLGIPIDGTKSEMIQKLQAKGFRYDAQNDCLKGEFNGHNVYLFVFTNKNRVYRIMVADKNGTNEGSIKIRFNRLVSQFKYNKKYIQSSMDDYTLSDDEDISYEMSVHNKRYQASFIQLPPTTNSYQVEQEMDSLFYGDYTYEQRAQLTKEQIETINDRKELYLNFWYSNSSVWFMINENYGQYRILMFYDNEYNEADGEDL